MKVIAQPKARTGQFEGNAEAAKSKSAPENPTANDQAQASGKSEIFRPRTPRWTQ